MKNRLIGKVRLQQLPSDHSIQMDDKTEVLREQGKISLFRSIVGSGIYLCPERYDVAFAVKEFASTMSDPTAMSFHHLKKFLGYLKKAMDYCLVVGFHKQNATSAWKHSQAQIGVETKAT